MIKTYRGLLADDGQDRIRLQTIKGKVGYKIVKFQVVPNNPIAATTENVIKIFKTSQSSFTNTINFTDSDLLAVATSKYSSPTTASGDHITRIIFDREMFNQDIFISNKSDAGSESMNYYLELETIALDDAGAEYTTLKDMRQA